jgi:hypothetical protein
MKDHLLAIRALVPKIIRHLRPPQQGTDFRTNKFSKPAHRIKLALLGNDDQPAQILPLPPPRVMPSHVMPSHVMAGLDPAIHALRSASHRMQWFNKAAVRHRKSKRFFFENRLPAGATQKRPLLAHLAP